jgi:hypothetical protein
MPLRGRPAQRVPLTILALSLVIAGVGADRCDAAEPATGARKPWTTSRVVGSPDPPRPFRVVRMFEQLKFDHPLLIVRILGSNRLVVGEQKGVLYSFADETVAKAELFFDLRKELRTIHLLPGAKEVEAVYGLAFHP